MEAKDKWAMFKNYMHNELGVDKHTIRTWIQEAVQEEARKIIENTFTKDNTKELLIKALVSTLTEKDMGSVFYQSNSMDKTRKEVINTVAEKILEEIKKR
jgi:hypothetical protein